MAVAIVFLHDLAHDPASWRRVADFIPPTWAITAPDLRDCASIAQMRAVIAHDLEAVTVNPRPGAERPAVMIVAEGPAIIPALDFTAHDERGVAGIVAISPQTSVSAFSGLKHRIQGSNASGPMRGALRETSATDVEQLRQTAISHGTRLWVLAAEKAGKPSALAGATVDVVPEAASDWIHYAPDALAAWLRQYGADILG